MRFEMVMGCWPAVAARLERAGTLSRWSEREPALLDVGSPAALVEATREGCDRWRADAVLGALVRLGSSGGGDDPQALVVLLHLLRPGVLALVDRFDHRDPDVLSLVIGELALQVRRYPVRRRTPGHAARLLLDTKSALWRGELAPIRDGSDARHAAPVDPAILTERAGRIHPVGDGVGPAAELAAVLSWAVRTGVADAGDVRMLLELELRRGYGRRARHTVADELGVHERTVRRRRDRVLGQLRAAAGRYSADAA